MRVLVLDSESTDATVSVAHGRGADVIVQPWQGFLDARLFALSQVRTPWTLMIDADEALNEELRDAVSAASGEYDGYDVLRTTFYRGKPIRMWSGERLLRLFRTDRARLEASPAAGGTSDLHERWTSGGATALLAGVLLHFSYPTHAAYREKFDRYTAIEARGVSASRAMALRESLLVPLRFLWYALRRGAALDGVPGLRVAWFSALYPAVVQWKALG
jgi:glycosyltransferase involved in cell wall biosynthesis